MMREGTGGIRREQVKLAIWASIILTVVLLVPWPLPLHHCAGVFSKGGCTAWVTLEMVWAIVGGIVITCLPPLRDGCVLQTGGQGQGEQ
jgi:hypothetical protein